jgi:phosphoribosylanthranilate isomerase
MTSDELRKPFRSTHHSSFIISFMLSTTTPRIKICCISSVAEAWMAIRHGASALGLVSMMPSGPGIIDEALITEIAATVPPGVASFLLTSQPDAGRIVAQQRRCRVNTIQLCDRLERGSYADLRRAMPGIRIVQVIHITGAEALVEAQRVAPQVDARLLDSGNQALATKELGGTGRTHNWEISRQIRDSVEAPIFLAGGIKPANLREATRQVQPFGIDLCSGVRTDGRLDESKLAALFEQVRGIA